MPDPVRPPLRALMLVLGMLSLAVGILAGLARVAVDVPQMAAGQAGAHGALMISGFFGTVISLERAVALGRRWAYLAPTATGCAVVALLFFGSAHAAQWLFVLAAVVLTAGSIRIVQRQTALFTVMLALAACCWLVGNLVWLADGIVHAALPWWLSFLVLTIAGERLELTRFLPGNPLARPLFILVSAAIVLGATLSLVDDTTGSLFLAVGLFFLAMWLLTFDIARHNARLTGLTRFIAICLLTGYIWLALGALLGMSGAFTPGAPLRDAALHALTLGFVFAMVFGHAPIIFPAVLRVKIAYHPLFYVPLVVLHASLALRVVGAVFERFDLLRYGALGNALALLLFIATMATCAFRNRNRAHTGRDGSR